jgi:hypothetical protein
MLFTQDKHVSVLLATDAAGEGINLQRAHLMVNYDLPWNPNRLEQRFGRIHRIGQTEVCHLWNLVAADTREGEVFDLLLTKLERAREALGGRDAVYDVLGRVFRGTELRDLLIEAIRYGERPDVKAKLHQQLELPLDTEHIRDLLEEHALAHDAMDASKLQRIREEMERAEAQKLQPHYISSFFRAAFQRLGGTIHEREADRWEITHVPTPIRVREAGVGGPILQRYERITFEKARITIEDGPVAEYVCPGHPLLEATIDTLLERNVDVLSRGAILVDNSDPSDRLRLLTLNEHTIGRAVGDRVLSRRMQFVQVDEAGDLELAGPAPHLNCDPASAQLREQVGTNLQWVDSGAAIRLKDFAVQQLVPDHIREVTDRQQRLVKKAMAAVQDRLTKEIAYEDRRAEDLKAQAAAGRQPKMNPQRARERADELRDRLQARMQELKQDLSIVPRPPVSLGAALIVPAGFVRRLAGNERPDPDQLRRDEVERLAMEAVAAAERRLGFEPEDVSKRKIGYDLESRDPKGGPLRFIEVKGRVSGADTVTITRNEVTVGLNSPDRFILAIALVEGDRVRTVHYLRRPFGREPDFGVTSLNYDLAEFLRRAEPPK